MPAVEHCLLFQALVSNYKKAKFILAVSLSRMVTASQFMLHGTPFKPFSALSLT